MATLWMVSGDAKDVIAWVKREKMPADTIRAETLVGELDQCIAASDFIGATEITAKLNRELFKLRATEAAPFVKAGRKQRAGLATRRDAHNSAFHLERANEWERWNQAAAQHWKPGSSKNQVASTVKRKLHLEESIPTIARRLKKPQQAS
jgi:hypothetical protein